MQISCKYWGEQDHSIAPYWQGSSGHRHLDRSGWAQRALCVWEWVIEVAWGSVGETSWFSGLVHWGPASLLGEGRRWKRKTRFLTQRNGSKRHSWEMEAGLGTSGIPKALTHMASKHTGLITFWRLGGSRKTDIHTHTPIPFEMKPEPEARRPAKPEEVELPGAPWAREATWTAPGIPLENCCSQERSLLRSVSFRFGTGRMSPTCFHVPSLFSLGIIIPFE